MYMWPIETVPDGILATPIELNAELEAVIGKMNGRIDRDNVPDNLLTPAEFELGAFHVIDRDQTDAAQSVVHTSSHFKQGLTPIPDENGDPWIRRVTVPDCSLDITLSATFRAIQVDQEDARRARLALVIQVDGVTYAVSGIPFGKASASLLIDASVPVGAGTHIVEAKYSLHESVLARYGTGQTVEIEWRGRSLWTRGACR